MRPENQFVTLLKQESRPERRILLFSGLLTEALGQGSVIVVGGSAIEILTAGRYVSGDIDLTIANPDQAVEVLKKWGFQKGGRLWCRPDLSLFVDIVSRDYSGSEARLREIGTPFGLVRIAAVEDCLVKRLASAKHWRIPTDIDHAELLLREYKDSIDWEYLQFRAKYYAVEDLLGDLRRFVEQGPRAMKRRAVKKGAAPWVDLPSSR